MTNEKERLMVTTSTRREVLRKGAVGVGLGTAALAVPGLAKAGASEVGSEKGASAAVVGILQLQADFHRAKSTQDLDLMASLWAEDAILNNLGIIYSGRAAIRALFKGSGSFTHRRMSFVPSFKEQVRVRGEEGYLYFECHDADLTSGLLVMHLYLAGTVRNAEDRWVFQKMTGGPAPLSVTEIYFP
jgi:ketosteroid isomerase-like protein